MAADSVHNRRRRRGAELSPAVRTEGHRALQVGAATIAKHVSPPDNKYTEVIANLFQPFSGLSVGRPPGPRPTPPSACRGGAIPRAKSASGGTRADLGVRPTTVGTDTTNARRCTMWARCPRSWRTGM